MANIHSFPNNQDTYIGAEEVAKWLHGRTSGVFAAGENAAVSAVAGTMAIHVSDGYGWLSDGNGNGIAWWNDYESVNNTKLQLSVDMADGTLHRIDRVIVSWTTTQYTALPEIKILKGALSSSPSAPELTNNSTTRQISLARIYVAAGTTAITASMITDERLDDTVCGYVTDSLNVDTSVAQAQLVALLNEIEYDLAQIIAGAIPAHASSHASGGADPISLASIGAEPSRLQFANTLVPVASWSADTSGTDGAATYADYPYRASVPLTGVLASMTPDVVFAPADATSGILAPVEDCYDGGIYLYASEIPEAEITIPTIILWKAVS